MLFVAKAVVGLVDSEIKLQLAAALGIGQKWDMNRKATLGHTYGVYVSPMKRAVRFEARVEVRWGFWGSCACAKGARANKAQRARRSLDERERELSMSVSWTEKVAGKLSDGRRSCQGK